MALTFSTTGHQWKEIEKIGHNWGEWQRVEKCKYFRICAICDKKEIEEFHAWCEWSKDRNGSVRTCSECKIDDICHHNNSQLMGHGVNGDVMYSEYSCPDCGCRYSWP